jgi:muramoyltetrapeptide carboxypeptidase LdcA involved in peptidoglycan recycling
MTIFPRKLHKGDEIRIVTPSKSISFVKQPILNKAVDFFTGRGLKISFGKHVHELDEFNTSPVSDRVADLHAAFADTNVKAIFSAVGGSSANQLLKYLNFSLIKANPKIFCGLSDITALSNAIYKKTGLVTYSGPHAPLFGASKCVAYTWEYFEKCLLGNEPFSIEPSSEYCDHRWDEKVSKTQGYWLLNAGEAIGVALGGNLLTLNFLQGSDYMPSLKNSVVFIEDNDKETVRDFRNQLQSLLNQKDAHGIKGLAIGRFQRGSEITKDLLTKIVKSQKELKNIPVLANVDFGHTTPMITVPIGGKVSLQIKRKSYQLNILKH